MKGILIASGNKIKFSILEKYITSNNFIVCADGGIKNFLHTNLKPNLIVGDFDSISEEGKSFIKSNNIEVKTFPPEKDFTDSELALDELMKKRVDEIILLGVTGSRLDHTLGNLLMLKKLYKKVSAKIIDNNNEIIYFEKGKYKLFKDKYEYLSVIAISDEVKYSSRGLYYEVNNLTLNNDSIRGVSNKILSESAELIIHSGSGFFIKSFD
ncbi:MAG: thiamine diphosphokinase [Peptoniphilaceae bacterium]